MGDWCKTLRGEPSTPRVKLGKGSRCIPEDAPTPTMAPRRGAAEAPPQTPGRPAATKGTSGADPARPWLANSVIAANRRAVAAARRVGPAIAEGAAEGASSPSSPRPQSVAEESDELSQCTDTLSEMESDSGDCVQVRPRG